MKKIILLLAIFYGNMFCSAQKNKECLKKVFSEAPELHLPLSIKSNSNLKYKEIEDDLVICALLNNDKSKLYYQFEYYDNDLMKNMKDIRKYYFTILGLYKIDKFNILIYDRSGNDTLQIILCLYRNETLIDKIIVGLEIGESEIIKYKESIITDNLEINSKYYEWNPKYLDKNLKDKTGIPKTIVTLTDYKIDKVTGKIILIKQERRYSDCIPEEFSYPNSNCQIFEKL